MTSRDFSSVLTDRSELLHRLAVYQEIVEHLRKFLDTDAAPAKLGITTEGGGLTVPQVIIESVVGELESVTIEGLKQELENIGRSKVAENVGQENEGRKKKEPENRKGEIKNPTARSRKTTRKPASRRSGVRPSNGPADATGEEDRVVVQADVGE